MTMRKKLLITIACLSCILCIMVTGTIAWLIDDTETITNTFTPSNITVELKETGTTNNKQEFQMIPGKTYAKDPLVTVTTDIPCYVFVEVEADLGVWSTYGNFADFYTYSVVTGQNGWTKLESVNNVYYREVSTSGSFYVLNGIGEYTNGAITVNGANVTKAMMDALVAAGSSNYPTLKFTAYACQKEGFNSAALAWAEINK